MNFSIDTDSETGSARIVVSGDIGLEDLQRLFLHVWSDPVYSRVERALWNLVDARTSMRFDDLMQLARWAAANKQGRGPKMVAVATTDDVMFGMSRMFDSLQHDLGLTIRVFRSVEGANEWLRSASGSA